MHIEIATQQAHVLQISWDIDAVAGVLAAAPNQGAPEASLLSIHTSKAQPTQRLH